MHKVVDLFAGAGGLSLGFENTGKFSIVAAVENNKNAIKTYKHNNKDVEIFEDIKTLDFGKILSKHGEIDVVIGGPPCQGFSNANRQKSKIINGNNELVKKYVAAVETIRPKVFVLENVKSLASNKHMFYLTEDDRKQIAEILQIKIHKSDTILYEGNYQISELFKSVQSGFFRSLMMSQRSVSCINSIIKNKNNIGVYLQKKSNSNILNEIINSLRNLCNLVPTTMWYVNTLENAIIEVENLRQNRNDIETNIWTLEKTYEMQKLFSGINELESQGVIYKSALGDNKIIAKMDTYVVIDYIKKSFEHLGYYLRGEVLQAANYGVPQKRERYILIGVKKTNSEQKPISKPEIIIKDESKFKTVEEAISDLVNYEASENKVDFKVTYVKRNENQSFYDELVRVGNDIYNHVCTNTRSIARKRFELIESGQNFHSLPDALKTTYADPKRTQNTIYKRLRNSLPSDTVVNVRKSMWIHPTLNRAISAREAARLQSFPDDYRFIGTKDSIYQQIGNAVPPILAQAIGEEVLSLLGDSPQITLKEVFEKYNDEKLIMESQG